MPGLIGLASGDVANQHVGQFGALIFSVTVQYLVVHLSLEEQVYETFPGKADATMKLHGAA